MKRCKLVLLSAICIMMASQAHAQIDPSHPTFGTIAVRLQDDGTLTGTIGYIDPSSVELVPIEGVQVQFIQHGRVMAEAKSSANGQLAVRGLTPQAVYSVMARATFDGREWFMAHGVSVLAAQPGEASAAHSRRPAYRLTAARARKLNNLNLEQMAQPNCCMAMIPQGDFGVYDDVAPVVGEGPLGGGGGGGGGGFGGGLAAAAVAAGVAIAASDDSEIVLSSPFRP